MSKMKPYLWIASLTIGLIAGWFVNGWRLNGHIETIRADHATATAKASEEARKKEQELQGQVDALQVNLKKEQKNADTKIARLNTDIAAGRVRLTVPATCGTGENPGAWAGEARAELDAETAQSLVAIASDGDTAIRELNYCIDAYEAVKGSNSMRLIP